jgi:hypothetical protein
MRSDVHSAALRAAAKVAFSVAFISGCAAPGASTEGESDPNDPTAGYDDTEVSTSESNLGSKKKPATTTTRSSALTSGCHKEAGAPKPLTCEQVINAAFPTEGNYPGEKQSVSVQVQTCCAEALASETGWMMEHRWDCCANLPADAGQNLNIACTPWGPPVPPSMKNRIKRANPMPDAWINLAEVA